MVELGSYTCRQLTTADVVLLKNLLGVFGAAFGEIDTYQRSVPSDGYLTRLLKKEHFITVVAMKGKEVVGGLAAYLLALAVTVLSIPHARWAGATRLRSSSRA